MNSEFNFLQHSLDSIKQKIPYAPDISLVLGSGLGNFLDDKKIDAIIKYNDIIDFPCSTVDGHNGEFVFLELFNKKIVCMNGRVHHYEGYDTKEVVKPIRLMKLMGSNIIILTNAAGGINKTFVPGDLMIINDHISQFVKSPLIGQNINELGKRFPDMSEVYNKKYIELLKEISNDNNLGLKEGVYIQFSGPNYETPAEIRMASILGADAVGMSTVVEAIVAKHMDMDVIGISLITNMASGISQNKLNHEEVKQEADKSKVKFEMVINQLIKNI